MTGLRNGAGGGSPSPLPRDDGSGANPAPAGSDRAPGLFAFTIEGRRAPGLFFAGWLAAVVGAGLLIVGLGGGGTAGMIFTIAGLAGLGLGLTALAGSQAIEARGFGPPGTYAGPSPVLVFAAAVPIALLLAVAASPVLAFLAVDPASPAGAFVSLLATAAAYLGLLRLLVVGSGALTWGEMGLRRPEVGLLLELLFGAVLAVPVLFFTSLLALLVGEIAPLPEAPLPPASDPLGHAFNIAAGTVLAPIVEEIFFRGYATTVWLRRHGATGAIVRGALFFAFAHVLTVGGATFGEGLARAAVAFVIRLPIALVLGWIFVRRGSLPAAIGCHATFNGIPLLTLALAG